MPVVVYLHSAGVGPGLGAILAAAFYKLMKILEYETANPGQDAAFEGAEEKLPEIETDADADVDIISLNDIRPTTSTPMQPNMQRGNVGGSGEAEI